MRLTLFKLCRFADRLAEGNPVIVGLYSRVVASRLPTRLDPSYLVVEIETDPGETPLRLPSEIRLIDEDGHVLTRKEGILEIGSSGEPHTHRTFFSVPIPWDDNFIFRKGGMYRFDMVLLPPELPEVILGGETLLVTTIGPS